MSVQITDCTIRDGGYLFNKNSAPEFVKGIMKGLADAGIDYVETGLIIMGNILNGCEFLLHNMKLMNLWNFAKVRKIKDILFNSILWIQ